MFGGKAAALFLCVTLHSILEVASQRNRIECVPGKAQFPNPNDRHSFYKCDAGGNAILFNCPPGTWFNPRLEVCDWDTGVESGGNSGGGSGWNSGSGSGGNTGGSGGNTGGSGGNTGGSGGNTGGSGGNTGGSGGNTGGSGGSNGGGPIKSPDFATGGNWWSQPERRPEDNAASQTDSSKGGGVAASSGASCTPSGPLFAPNPQDCAAFFVCSRRRWQLSSCSPGTYFDPPTARCRGTVPKGCKLLTTNPSADDDVWQYRRFG